MPLTDNYAIDQAQVVNLLSNVFDGTFNKWDKTIAILRSRESKRTLPHLEDLLNGPDPDLRCNAAEALIALDPSSAVPKVLHLLRDEVTYVRFNLCIMLCDYPDSRAVESLIETLLHDPDSNTRYHAAVALGKIRDKRAVEALQWAEANDSGKDYEDDPVSRAARRALGKILDQE